MEGKINFLFQEANNLEDEELQSHFLNYICVMLSGYIEVNINRIIKECKKDDFECKQNVATTQNATWCKIKPIFALIDLERTVILNQKINDTDIIDILYEIIGDRNSIAHGKNITTLNLPKLKNSFESIKKFISEIEETFECS